MHDELWLLLQGASSSLCSLDTHMVTSCAVEVGVADCCLTTW